LHLLWEKISLKCGSVELDNPTSSYAYKDYFLKLLNYGHEEKITLFSSAFFYKDTAGQFDNYSVTTETEETVVIKKESLTNGTSDSTIKVKTPRATNAGFLQRRNLLIENKGKIELMGQLQCDLFSTESYILPGTSGKKVEEKVSEGKIPNKIIFGLSNFSYNTTSNPFNFRNFNVNRIECRVGKNQRPYTFTLNLDYPTNHNLNGYII
jgi:hypothetical protein